MEQMPHEMARTMVALIRRGPDMPMDEVTDLGRQLLDLCGVEYAADLLRQAWIEPTTH